MSSFFNLPSPWNPGYALPENVKEEGLYRPAITTAQYPDGFYDVPAHQKYGTYATPAYIQRELPGDGAHVTKWLPRGTFFETILQGKALPKSPAITDYGRKAANYLIRRVQRLPAPERPKALKLVLDKIDKSLWLRAEAAARPYLKSMGPQRALEVGLAEAMSAGVTKELMDLGARRKAPAPKSLLGLGCYGCAAVLGDVAEALGDEMTREHRGEPITSTAPRVRPPAPSSAPTVQVGPFTFPAGGTPTRGSYIAHTSTLPSSWKTWLANEVKRLSGLAQGWGPAVGRVGSGPARQFGLDKWLGMNPNDGVVAQFFDGTAPLFKSKDPVTGHDMGIFVISSPTQLEVWYRDMTKKDKPWWKKAWDAIKSVPGKVAGAVVAGAKATVEFAKDALSTVASLGCRLVNTQAAQTVAAGAGSTPTPQGQAVAAGAAVASSLCTKEGGDEVPTPVPAPPPPASIPIVPLAIGGAALFLLLRRGS